MTSDLRKRNLYLARYLYDGLGKLATELTSVTTQAELIRMGQGKKKITNSMSKAIEEKLELPPAWMDRDNEYLIRMSPQEYAIHKKVLMLSAEGRRSLLSFLASLPLAN